MGAKRPRLVLRSVRAAAARQALVLDDLAIKVVLGLDNAAKEHPAAYSGAGGAPGKRTLNKEEPGKRTMVVLPGSRPLYCAKLTPPVLPGRSNRY